MDTAQLVVGMLALTNVVSLVALRYVVVHLYMYVRRERDTISRNRDEWRGVAERALLMAQVNQSLIDRAAALLPASSIPPHEPVT